MRCQIAVGAQVHYTNLFLWIHVTCTQRLRKCHQLRVAALFKPAPHFPSRVILKSTSQSPDFPRLNIFSMWKIPKEPSYHLNVLQTGWQSYQAAQLLPQPLPMFLGTVQFHRNLFLQLYFQGTGLKTSYHDFLFASDPTFIITEKLS